MRVCSSSSSSSLASTWADALAADLGPCRLQRPVLDALLRPAMARVSPLGRPHRERPVGARPASLASDWPAHPLAAQREAARHLGGAYMNLMHPTGKRAPRLESPREKALRRGAYTRPWLAGRLWRFPTKGSRPAHHTRHQPPVASSAMHVYGT